MTSKEAYEDIEKIFNVFVYYKNKCKQLEKENQNPIKVYAKLLKKYGDAQIIVAIEELSELQKELCKALRNKSNYDNIVEEIADVEIMLEQMKIYFEISEDEIEEMKEIKTKRTKERLGL